MNKKKLDKIVKQHGEWLLDPIKGKRADLRRADLRGAYLQGADLRRADLQDAYLQGADLRRADLRGADLQDADLQGADLRGADLQDAYLYGADLRGADLRGAYLQGADLRDADLQGADLSFSSWPLHCGSFSAKADERLVSQLIAHVVRLNVSECKEQWVSEAMKALAPFADKFCEFQSDVARLGGPDADSK